MDKEEKMGLKLWAFFVVPLIICTLGTAFGLLGYFLGYVFGIPQRFHLPIAMRGLGAIVLGIGFALLGWIFRYRKPGAVLVSTYVTMCKSIRRTPPQEKSARSEPLVLQGPQRYVRHPMYLADVLLFLGWWLVLDYTLILFLAFFFFLWFNLVVIPFEEQELKALYGKEYEAYARSVPRFFPSLNSRWR
jgi:protein-S-isoprenylcysteine O-methyltransferase Ste14